MIEAILTILVIEDEEVLRESMADFLEDRGFIILTAANGWEGVKRFDSENPDIVITDLRMPEMDGFEVIKYITATNANIPIIVVSGAGDICDAIKALKTGAWDYILKPVTDMSIITYAIGQVVEKARLIRENREYSNHLELLVAQRTEELQKAQSFQQSIIDGISDIIMVVNYEHTVVTINKAGRDRCNYSETNEMKCYHFFGKHTFCISCPFTQVFETGRPSLTEHLHVDIEGTDIPYEVIATPIFDKAGNVVQAIGVFRNISERRKAETEKQKLENMLRQAEKMDAIGQLAGGVAHDFNNMLAGIMGGGELLKSYLPDDQKCEKFHEMIMVSAKNAAALTEKLLSFSRKQPVTLAAMDIHSTIHEVVEFLKNTIDRRIKIKVNLSEEASCVIGDASQLQNTLLNLGINASHAMPDGGTIYFSSHAVELNSSYCELSAFDIAPGFYLEIEVRDTGCGITPENINKIFDPFFTTKRAQKGTGLGLSAVFSAVQQHNGAVTVYSELGVGTSFRILLPLVDSEAVCKHVATCRKIPGTGRILVVDDESSIRNIAESILSELGYEVILAENGQEAVDIFSENAETVDLVLLDMIMPEMNGKDCFTAMQKIKPEVIAILSSGFSHEDDVEQMLENGLYGFIQKPYKSAALSQIVHNAITSRSSGKA